MTVCIDPGHGGKDSGAVGSSNGYHESTGVLNIALMVRDILQPHMKVVMTREKDEFISLAERCRIANNTPDCTSYVSIHLNSATNETANGWEVFTSGSKDSRILSANVANSHLCSFPSQTNRGVKEGPNLYVIKKSKMPATLWEGCFLSNENEADWVSLPETQKQMAKAIAIGVLNYYGIDSQTNNRELTLEERVDRIEKRLDIS